MVGVMTPGGKLSALNIDTDLVMGAHNVTMDAAQTVDGEDVSEMNNLVIKVSNTLIASHDASEDVSHISIYTLWKKFTVSKRGMTGGIRVKFSLQNTIGGADRITHGKIYHNATPIGTERTLQVVDTVEYSEDLDVDLEVGDNIAIWGYGQISVTNHKLSNFRIYYDAEMGVLTGD